jgi:hypothetical protein
LVEQAVSQRSDSVVRGRANPARASIGGVCGHELEDLRETGLSMQPPQVLRVKGRSCAETRSESVR